jgi:hypothetical protein
MLKGQNLESLRERFKDVEVLLMVTKSGAVGHYFPNEMKEVRMDPGSDDCTALLKVPHNGVTALKVKHKSFVLKGGDAYDYLLGKKPYIWDPKEKYYIRGYNSNKTPEWVRKLSPGGFGMKHNVTFYVSNKDITTNMHVDTNPGFIVQIRGRKRVLVWLPKDKKNLYFNRSGRHPLYRRSRCDTRLDEDAYRRWPNIAKTNPIEIILHPDDCLYVPAGWVHYVESLDDVTISTIVRYYPTQS